MMSCMVAYFGVRLVVGLHEGLTVQPEMAESPPDQAMIGGPNAQAYDASPSTAVIQLRTCLASGPMPSSPVTKPTRLADMSMRMLMAAAAAQACRSAAVPCQRRSNLLRPSALTACRMCRVRHLRTCAWSRITVLVFVNLDAEAVADAGAPRPERQGSAHARCRAPKTTNEHSPSRALWPLPSSTPSPAGAIPGRATAPRM